MKTKLHYSPKAGTLTLTFDGKAFVLFFNVSPETAKLGGIEFESIPDALEYVAADVLGSTLQELHSLQELPNQWGMAIAEYLTGGSSAEQLRRYCGAWHITKATKEAILAEADLRENLAAMAVWSGASY